MCVCVFFLFSQGGQLVGLMPVLAACHLIYICSGVLHYIAIHVVANKVLSLSLMQDYKSLCV